MRASRPLRSLTSVLLRCKTLYVAVSLRVGLGKESIAVVGNHANLVGVLMAVRYAFFVSINSGLVMDVRGGINQQHALIQQFGFHGGNNQRWNVIPTIEIDPEGNPDEVYIAPLISPIGADGRPERVLDITGASLEDGAAGQLFDFHGGRNQTFRIILVESNVVAIIAQHSGKCLDVEHVSRDPGALIHQIGYHGAANQQWRPVGGEFLCK